eukprot:10660622-Ditylum_brightwellii.AAC.1
MLTLALTRPGPLIAIAQVNTGNTNEIKHKLSCIPHNILDHFKATGGSNRTQKEMLKQKADKYTTKAMTSALEHREAFTIKSEYNRCMVYAIREGTYEFGGASFTSLVDI